MIRKDQLKVGMIVEVQSKYDAEPLQVEITVLTDGLNFLHKTLSTPIIRSAHSYKDILRIIKDVSD